MKIGNISFNKHGKLLPHKVFTTGSKLVMALGCNFTAYLFNQDSLITQIAFGLTVLGVVALVFAEMRHLSTDKLLTVLKKDSGLRYGSLIIFATLIFFGVIPPSAKIIISFVMLVPGTALLLAGLAQWCGMAHK